jgi:hypothetical protein
MLALEHLLESIPGREFSHRRGRRELPSDIKEYGEGFAKGKRRPKESFLKRLQEATEHFEITHPTRAL